MDVIYGLIPGMILLGLLAVGVFFWAARSGQFDDLEGEASRILMDDDDLPKKSRAATAPPVAAKEEVPKPDDESSADQ